MQIKWLYAMTSVLHADLLSKTWKASDSGHELSEQIVMQQDESPGRGRVEHRSMINTASTLIFAQGNL